MSEETDPPPPLAPAIVATSEASAPTAVWSLVLGIFSFACGGFITAIPAIVCGHLAKSAIRKSAGTLRGGGMATAGLILGYTALLFYLVLIPAFVIPAVLGEHRMALERAARTQEMTASDKSSRVTVSGNWVEMPGLNEKATLQIANKQKGQYLIVLSEIKSDFDEMTVQKHHQLTHDAMLKKLKNSSATNPVSITIGDHPAFQDEISGTQSGTNVVFLHTTVDDGKYYHQVLCWTLKSRWEQNREELRTITNTLRGKQ
jgi:hypothetical protein